MIGGLPPILLYAPYLIVVGGHVLLHRLSSVPLWLASWLPAVDKSRSSRSVKVRRVWEVYDERLQFMSRRDALLLDASLAAVMISQAWAVWSGAVESALVDAYQFSGGPLPSRGLVLGRGRASFRVV